MKSITTTPTGKLLIDIPALRAELIACKWRLGSLCIDSGHTPGEVRAALKAGKRGSALLAEYMAKRPRSGPSGKTLNKRPRVELLPSDSQLEQLRDACEGEPLGPWILKRVLGTI